MPVARLAADTLVVNGLVRTLDAVGSVAAAVAVKDARIIGVGTADELRPLLDKQTEVSTSRGRTVCPASSTRTPTSRTGPSPAPDDRLAGQRQPESSPQALEDVRQRAAALPPGRVDPRRWHLRHAAPERRMPTRWELDAVAPDRPVALIGGRQPRGLGQ